MANESGTPPKGESASTDVVPQSRPVEASELDDGWVDVLIEASPSPDLPAAGEGDPPVASSTVAGEVAVAEAAPAHVPSVLPQSLSPVVLSASEGRSAAPPAEAVEPAVKPADVAAKEPPAEAKPAEAEPAEAKPVEAEPAEAKQESKRPAKAVHSDRRLGKKLKSGYVLVPVVVLAAGIALIVLRPKEIAPEKPIPAQTPAAAAQVPVQAEDQPLVSPPKVEEQAAPSANAQPVDSAAAAASAGPLPSASAASGDTFLDAFHKNAAKSNSKWAGIKPEAAKSDNAGSGVAKPAAAKPAATKPTAAKAPVPGQVDPLDVLKRLEEARKNKK